MCEIVQMLVSLTGTNDIFLFWVWVATFTFFGAAILLCAGITIRRAFRNRRLVRKNRQKSDYQRYLIKMLKEQTNTLIQENNEPDCDIEDKTEIFLHYFRTLKGEKLEHLQDLISQSNLEDQIIQSTYVGTRGVRMQAVKVLSYLNSQSSLENIFSHLDSADKYIRLTAARCLVRRKGLFFINAIIEACIEGFPNDHKLLADILSRFGTDAVEALENTIERSDNATAIAGCLEALNIIMPPKLSINYRILLKNPSPSVRSATVALSAFAPKIDNFDPLRTGLKDESIAVQIRAAKTACELKRSDLTSELFDLTSSPVTWVTYWSIRAIWASGKSGEKFVHSISSNNPMARKVALEMRSGYV